MKKVWLKPTKEKSLLSKHPWVFSSAIRTIDDNIIDGDIVEVFNNKDRYMGTGHYNEGTITVRLFEFNQQKIDKKYWETKIQKANELRTNTLSINNNNNVYRLVHAEGDYMPGCIIDIYNNVAVFQFHSIGMWKLKEVLSEIVQALMPKIELIYDKSEGTLSTKHKEEFSITNNVLYQEKELDKTLVSENGNLFNIDWVKGQKTGFFIDQRENRKLLGELCKDKKVLNTFCYSGGFSIYALNSGANEVHSLDSSQKAIDLVDENLDLIPDLNSKHKSIVGDAMDYIKNLEDQYDIIILDPPAFAKHMKVKHKALQGYKRLNTRAIEQIKPNGLLFTFSCSQVISNDLFKHMILSSAIAAERNVSILHQLHQPSDHPVNIFHPESEYLKGLVLKIE
jgi:23S rRNA (cytosine1962-C5)-methyltransferase